MATISIFGSHDAAIAVAHNGAYVTVSIESLLGQKDTGLTNYLPLLDPNTPINTINSFLKKYLGIDEYDRCVYNELGPTAPFILTNIALGKEAHLIRHHQAHALSSFHQSPFSEALVICCDSGGDDGAFNIFVLSRTTELRRVKRVNLNLAYAYMILGHFLKPIKREQSLLIANLHYAQKVMDLSAYGAPRKPWVEILERLLRGLPLDGTDSSTGFPTEPHNYGDFIKVSRELCILFDLPLFDGVDGISAYDLAASAQSALENVYLSEIASAIAEYPHLPLCLAGGCAKNIYLNTKVREHFKKETFVAADMDNKGIALGMLFSATKPQTPLDTSYFGPPLFEKQVILKEAQERDATPVTSRAVARLLGDNKIVGIARGRADHGTYTLGNRTIFCDAATPNIKEYFYQAIKKLPSYTPFTVVVRDEKAPTYFENGFASYPTYAVKVKDSFQEKFSAITHVDGTARVQVLRQEQNPWLYEMLQWFETYSGHGLLLTSPLCFADTPIPMKASEVFDIFDKTLLEALVVEDHLFIRKSEHVG